MQTCCCILFRECVNRIEKSWCEKCVCYIANGLCGACCWCCPEKLDDCVGQPPSPLPAELAKELPTIVGCSRETGTVAKAWPALKEVEEDVDADPKPL